MIFWSLPVSAPRLLAHHADAALKLGATREQIVETVLQLTFYAGGPAVRDALIVLQEVLARAGLS